MENSVLSAYVSRANKFTEKQSCMSSDIIETKHVMFLGQKRKRKEKNEKEIGKEEKKRKEKT